MVMHPTSKQGCGRDLKLGRGRMERARSWVSENKRATFLSWVPFPSCLGSLRESSQFHNGARSPLTHRNPAFSTGPGALKDNVLMLRAWHVRCPEAPKDNMVCSCLFQRQRNKCRMLLKVPARSTKFL